MDAPHDRGLSVTCLGVSTPLLAALSGFAAASIGAAAGHRWTLRSRPIEYARKGAQVPVGAGDPISRRRRMRGLTSAKRTRIALIMLAFIVSAAVLGPLLTLTLLLSVLGVRQARPVFRARRHSRVVERELPGTIELLVLSIHAGLTPNQAIRELASSASESVRPAFVEIVHRMDRGEPFASAIVALPDWLGPRSVGLAEVIATADRYGLPLSQVLDQLSREARSTRRRLDEASARKLPIRLSFPLVFCTLPSFVLLAIAPAVIAALSSLGASAW
jgi:Flp pilus assembly protein TadB